MANVQQIRELHEIMNRVIECGADMSELKKQLLSNVPDDHVRAFDAIIPGHEKCTQMLGGDASKANGQFFQLRWRKVRDSGTYPNGREHGPAVDLVIYCPTFLRDSLRLTIEEGRVFGAY